MGFGGLISGFMQGMSALSTANKHDRYLRMAIGMVLSFWLTGAGVCGTVGLATLQLTNSVSIAAATGFFSGLVAASGAAFVRFTNDPLSKGIGITVSGEVTGAAETTLTNGGVDLQKEK